MSLSRLVTASTHGIEVKHSRFLANAIPVSDPDEALRALADAIVPDANHNCWAYRIGDACRSSDDGEPAGTAGRPILAAIDGQGIDMAMVVVTRWFGGIKLGAGGLARAYGGTAAECLRRAERQTIVAMRELVLHADFDDTGAVHAAMAQYRAKKISEDFDTQGCRLVLRLPTDNVATLKEQLRDATRNRVRFSNDDDR